MNYDAAWDAYDKLKSSVARNARGVDRYVYVEKPSDRLLDDDMGARLISVAVVMSINGVRFGKQVIIPIDHILQNDNLDTMVGYLLTSGFHELLDGYLDYVRNPKNIMSQA